MQKYTTFHQAESQEIAPLVQGELVDLAQDPEAGATTAEYGIVLLAAVGFAGLLVVILKSDAVRALLMGIVEKALSTGM